MEKAMKTPKSDRAGTQTVLDLHLRPKANGNFGLSPIRISALIPVYNRELTIARAIESVLNQEFPPAEIIVVDDGSNDRTWDIVASFGEKVRLVRQTNGGVSAARNRCARESACDWLAFLDSDDYWLPSHLRCISDAIRATDGQAAIYFSDLKCPPEGGMQSFWQKCGLQVPAPHELKLDGAEWVFMPVQPIKIPASVIRGDYYRECGGLPEEMRTREDTLLFFKLGLMYPLCAVTGCGAVVMGDGGNQLTKTMDEWSIEYARASVLLYESLAQMRSFVHGRRKLMIARSLSAAHFSLARANFRQKFYGSCFQSILRSGVTSPQICVRTAMESLKQTSPWLGSARVTRAVNASLETKK